MNFAKRIANLTPEQRQLLELKLQAKEPKLHPLGITRRKRDGSPLPLSFAQQRLWFLYQLSPQSTAYNIVSAVQLAGQLDRAALRRSFEEITRRHEILRTTFINLNGQPAQIIASEPKIDFTEREFCEDSADVKQRIHRMLQQEASTPFDLSRGPLLRVLLVRISDNRHVVMVSTHHIIMDGWSMAIFLGEQALLYNAFVNNRASPLPELSIQYGDYAAFQRDRITSESLRDDIEHWYEALSGAPGILNLPPDRLKESALGSTRGTVPLEIDRVLALRCKEFATELGLTPFMVLLGAFQLLLAKYSGQEDIVIGITVANRDFQELESLIGLFANTVPVRMRFTRNMTVRELFRQERETVLDALTHAHVPFEKIVERLRPERNLDRHPVFQVLFSLLNTPSFPAARSDLELESIGDYGGMARYDLALEVNERDGAYKGFLEYNADRFEASTMETLIERFKIVLNEFAMNRDVLVDSIPLLTDQERSLIESGNSQTRPYSQEATIDQLFRRQAERTPDACALRTDTTALTYFELDRLTDQMARVLMELGAQPESVIGICMQPTPAMVVALLGILKSGAAYLPLDPIYPIQRRSYMASDAGAAIMVADSDTSEEGWPTTVRIVSVDAAMHCLGGIDSRARHGSTAPGNLAYVMYTSGSTGQPKGVMLTHRNVVQFLSAIDETVGTKPGVWLATTRISFDISVLELLWTTCRGFEVRLEPQTRSGVPLSAFWEDTPSQHPITHFQCTPSLARLWEEKLLCSARFRSLEKLLVGGEALPPQLAERLRKHRSAELWNMYGPTEATVWATAAQLNSSSEVTLGHPLPNYQVHIVNRAFYPQPSGLPGELCIGGAGVARGYLMQPELTAESFVPDPFGKVLGARLYRTGDFARRLPDGRLEFLGRQDHQVKIKGHRVEIEEIEAVFLGQPQISHCVVLVREDGDGKYLAAYIVPNGPFFEESSRSHLRKHLPEHMIPSSVVVLESMPLLPSGKIDRKKLAAIEGRRSRGRSGFSAPRTAVEKTVGELWAQMLGVEKVSVHDDFFFLAGHSLLATQLVWKLREVFKVDLPLRSIFEAPTVSGLSQHLEQLIAEKERHVEREGPSQHCREAEGSTNQLLVTLQGGGDQLPIFWTAPLGYSPISYRALATRLGPNQPSYVLQPLPADLLVEYSDLTVEQIAAEYIREIERVQGCGPYQLGGWSSGGIVAFEVAQQLRQNGETVQVLLLLDSWAPGSRQTVREVDDTTLLVQIVRNGIAGSGAGIDLRVDELRSMSFEAQLDSVIREIRKVAPPSLRLNAEWLRMQLRGLHLHQRAGRKYRPRAYEGRVILLHAEETLSDDLQMLDAEKLGPDALFYKGWDAFAGTDIEVERVPGHHFTMLLEPQVGVLADKLRERLSDVSASENLNLPTAKELIA